MSQIKSIEQSVKDCISKELENGIIEKVITKNLEKCIDESVHDLFRWNGPLKKCIEENVKSVMLPFLEKYNYSEYITKLDTVMTEILKTTTLDHREILENFKYLVTSERIERVELTNLFNKYCDYCSKKIDVDDVEDMDYEGGYITCNFEVNDISSDWSSFDRKHVIFTCDEDENLNYEFYLSRYNGSEKPSYNVSGDFKNITIHSLRFANEIEIMILKLSQEDSPIVIDETEGREEVFVENRE